ncbi:MAG: SGNH/GDSL hydrolase family protein [Cyanobacteria bacterium SBLK]|nr:SGNH/GDSL hydrolase family protein [Cyanobacteria bacterium SBLK]
MEGYPILSFSKKKKLMGGLAIVVLLSAVFLERSRIYDLFYTPSLTGFEVLEYPHPDLANILIIGDSIVSGYFFDLRAEMAGVANVYGVPENARHSRYGLKQCDRWLGDRDWDIIAFNFGLHDIHFVKGVGIPREYRRNLEAIATKLQATNARIVWINTTPVPSRTLFRKAGEAERINAIAREIMTKKELPILDLWTPARKNLKTWQIPRDVHFRDRGSEELAKIVGAFLHEELR